MEQTEKTASETETERCRGVFLEGEGGIVEFQFFQGGGEFFVLVTGDWIE